MNNESKYMIDFETISTSKDASVIQIGAVSFCLSKKLKTNILNPKGDVSHGTVMWWLGQSEQARLSVLADPKVDEYEAFLELNDFLSGAEEIWSHATFDFVILMETLRRLKIMPSFSYRAARDIRTLQSLARIETKSERKGTHHDALDDAIFQVEYCLPSIQKLIQVSDGK